jgi:hypothetical protein
LTDDDGRELIREFGFLEGLLTLSPAVEVTLATDTLDFADLTSPGGGLDILEVHLGILAQVDHRTKVII